MEQQYEWNEMVRIIAVKNNNNNCLLWIRRGDCEKYSIHYTKFSFFFFCRFYFFFSHTETVASFIVVNITHNNSAMTSNNNHTMDDIDEDRVRKMYANRTLFITGGTGFLGKVLIEKLLR